MSNIYNQLFTEIFDVASRGLLHDFSDIKCQSDVNNTIGFCCSGYSKVFDCVVRVLEKARYNGEIVLPEHLAFAPNKIFPVSEILQNSPSVRKGRVKIEESGAYRLENARPENDVKSRIVVIPIDGASSFLHGVNDFSMCLVYCEKYKDDVDFAIKQVVIYNPILRDTCIFDEQNGMSLNNRKIVHNKILPDHAIRAIYTGSAEFPCAFNVSKLFSVSSYCATSSSIFATLALLATTSFNLCIYRLSSDKMICDIVDFCIKIASLKTKNVGKHIIFGNEKIVESVVK